MDILHKQKVMLLESWSLMRRAKVQLIQNCWLTERQNTTLISGILPNVHIPYLLLSSKVETDTHDDYQPHAELSSHNMASCTLQTLT